MAQTDTQNTHGHGNSMTELAQWGPFSENPCVTQPGTLGYEALGPRKSRLPQSL